MSTRQLYIFGLDGTLADHNHRRPMLDSGDWEGYFDACPGDTPIQPVIAVMHALYWSGAEIWIFSGRSDRVRAQTIDWLEEYTVFGREGCDETGLVMRRAGDTRPDDVIKQKMLSSMLHDDRQRLVAVFDNRDHAVAMWRRNGIQCFQVAQQGF